MLEAVDILLDWHAVNRQDYLWRDLRRTPYVVLVSEFMLQQTGARQVEAKLPPFLKKFPSVRALANATTAEVLLAWQGLGYNRRALNLQRTAQAIVARGRKAFPQTLDELESLPGVGPYTAAAVMSFSYKADVPVVDVNIERVLSRLWQQMPDYSAKRPIKEIWDLDREILPHGRSGLWHEALMDFGSTICAKRRPQCESCPLLDHCKSGPHFLRNKHRELNTSVKKIEAKFFGQPKRIWRGRVLSVIATKGPIAEKAIIKSLAAIHDDKSSEFARFIKSLIVLLLDEGFAKHHNGKVQLGK